MIPIEGHLNFFQVNHCGLYRVGRSKHEGCGLTETFELISDWIKDRPLSATMPWDFSSKPNKPKCYCKQIVKGDSGDFIVVLWKSETDGSGSIYGVRETDKPGDSAVIKRDGKHLGRNFIWGRPCYYWVIPSLDTIVSIKFEHSSCDAELFGDFVKSCIEYRVKHPNRVKSTTETGLIRLSNQDNTGHRLLYRFDMNLMTPDTSSAEINSLAKSVRAIVKRETVLVNSENEQAKWVRFFNKTIPHLQAKPKSKKRRIEVKAEAKPTKEEIQQIIQKHSNETRKPSDWDNIGFELENNQIAWVDRYRIKEKIHAIVPSASEINGNTIKQIIEREREKLTLPVRRAIKAKSDKSATDEEPKLELEKTAP